MPDPRRDSKEGRGADGGAAAEVRTDYVQVPAAAAAAARPAAAAAAAAAR